MYRFLVLLFLISTSVHFSQINGIKKFPYLPASGVYKASSLIQFQNNYYMFYYDSVEADTSVWFKVSKSSDGVNWGSPVSLFGKMVYNQELNVTSTLFNNKIVVLFKSGAKNYITTSADGINWSDTTKLSLNLSVLLQRLAKNFNFTANADTLYLSYNSQNLAKTADLINWQYSTVNILANNLSVIPFANKKALFYESNITNGKIYLSFLEGTTVSTPIDILPPGVKGFLPKAIKGNDGSYYVVFNMLNTAGPGVPVYDIAYIISTDQMVTWSQPVKYTTFLGNDLLNSVSPGVTKPIVSFLSERNKIFTNDQIMGISYGVLTPNQDSASGLPVVLDKVHYLNQAAFKLIIVASLDGISTGDINYLKYIINGSVVDSIHIYDDGTHGDTIANDKKWSVEFPFRPGDLINYTVNIKRGNLIHSSSSSFINLTWSYLYKNFMFDVNKIKMPLNSGGVLGDVYINGTSGVRYDDKVVIYSGGFYLTGKSMGTLWGNAVASASRIQDYIPGRVNVLPGDPVEDVFVVKNSDSAFSTSWLKWKDAVTIGAEFYDGNNDGIYNPVDLNNNGSWDVNEDKPFIIGDMTAWCVYNDKVPAELRRFNNQNPLGIEIQQTVFGVHTNDALNNNIVYVRYKILNKSYTQERLDSVIFSVWSDPDIGGYTDDLVGSDTLLNAGVIYNDSADTDYGINPPALYYPLLQGPQSYIPGVTFIDNNSNGVYDEGTDTALDTAYSKMGPLLGVKKYPGAKNLSMSSFIHYQASDPTIGDPNSVYEIRNYQQSLTRLGAVIDPCTWSLGIVTGGVNCSLVNNKYLYSGDPVTMIGWINNKPTDQRSIVNTGPFYIQYGKSVDIIAAYVVGRGSSALNSVTVAKNIADHSKQMWKTNFAQLPLSTDNDETVVKDFRLYQNYPNPFNPLTTIKYSLSERVIVRLEIFDILGRGVKVLLNEEQQAGVHQFNFNASGLSSGIYFYRLKAGSHTDVKKLLLLK